MSPMRCDLCDRFIAANHVHDNPKNNYMVNKRRYKNLIIEKLEALKCENKKCFGVNEEHCDVLDQAIQTVREIA